MTKLEDILSVSYSDVVIMDGYGRVIAINCEFDMWKNFSKDFFEQRGRKN